MGRHILADPGLTAPLEERSLLRVLEPKDWIDEEATNQLANIIVEMLTNGAFDDLPKADYFGRTVPVSNGLQRRRRLSDLRRR